MLEILVSPYRGLSRSSKFFKVPKEAWEETLEIFWCMSLGGGGRREKRHETCQKYHWLSFYCFHEREDYEGPWRQNSLQPPLIPTSSLLTSTLTVSLSISLWLLLPLSFSLNVFLIFILFVSPTPPLIPVQRSPSFSFKVQLTVPLSNFLLICL